MMLQTIKASELRKGDQILEERRGRHGNRYTKVDRITRYSKVAMIDDKFYHGGCRGVHVNGGSCYPTDLLLEVVR